LFFGKRSLVNVNVKVTADLIVIEGSQDNDANHHPYYNATETNVLNGIDIFRQDVLAGEDSDKFNGYWTENPTNERIAGMSQEDMQAALRRLSSGELYLWGYYYHGLAGLAVSDLSARSYCWSIGIDTETGEPFVNKYEKIDDISSTSHFYWLNSVMKSRIQGRLRTIGDIVIGQTQNPNVQASDLSKIDITGENNTGVGPETDEFAATDIRDLLDTDDTQWNFNTIGFGPYSGNNALAGQGSFEYYGVEGEEPTGAIVKPEHRGLQNSFMYQTHQTVVIQDHEYFVVYEVSKILPPTQNIRSSYLSKVFLCRKKQ